MSNNKPRIKIRRVRLNPTKKWTNREEKLLIEFLLQNKEDFESPTAQIFYRRFCSEKQLTIDWKLVRSKVRNMRISYNKTKSALDSTNGEIQDDPTFRKCSHYKELDMIFSEQLIDPSRTWVRYCKNSTAESDDSMAAPSERSDLDTLPTSSTNNRYEDSNKTTIEPGIIIKAESFCMSEQSCLTEAQDEVETDVNINTTTNNELSIEERKLALAERKLLLKERKLNSDEKIKIYKINSREKLKIIELEMHERLALEELKFKYK